MKMRFALKSLFGILAIFLAQAVVAQGIPKLSDSDYNQLKREGNIPASWHGTYGRPETGSTQLNQKPKPTGQVKGGGGLCECWIAPDASYTLAMQPNDDGSSALITIPFTFDLYGDLYTDLYINNNGNVSFQTPYITFTANPFPDPGFVMVAPFWGDVDTRGIGDVWYKVTPTAIYVNWVDVGYYDSYTDKINNFQLILTDGTDPVIGIGNNVSFCYKDMQWTTGDASSGVNGFGGTAAIVGANRGNGTEFIQFGGFDQAGGAYDGPFGNNDGIDWLDDKNFEFSVATTTTNVAPIASSAYLCDTLIVCEGNFVQLQMDMLSPEQNQITTTTSTSTLSNYTEAVNTSGITSTIVGEFTPTAADVGFHSINYSATDNGVPNLTTVVNIVIEVVAAPTAPPTITGPTTICQGSTVTLTANGTFGTFDWSNGVTGSSVTVGGGTYTVSGFSGGCLLTSQPFVVVEQPNPIPTILGGTALCDASNLVLSVDSPYVSYNWSNGSPDPSITVGTGMYSVTVADALGCTGTATTTVSNGAQPTALFSGVPSIAVDPGFLLQVSDMSTIVGGSISSWDWDFGNGTTFNGQLPPDVTYPAPGFYNVILTVTSSDGCTSTYALVLQVGLVDPVIPNVFSPNSDGSNDQFYVQGIEFARQVRLEIYNRWGQVIYESTNYRNNWRAEGVSDGTYFYVLTLNDGRDYTGHVTLLR